MPDLSSFVPAAPATRAAAATPAAATVSTAAGDLAADAGTVPPYYRDFIKQSDEVRKRLRRVGEPEMPAAAAPGGIQRAAQTTMAFEQAAHRHRHSS